MIRAAVAAAVLAVAVCAPVQAAGAPWPCWNQAAARYDVDAAVLYAIARVETGSRSGVVSKPNRNGSYDIGLMQINSSWLPMLERDYGITEQMLRSDACLNLHVGALILSYTVKKYGLNWRGVGAYNAVTDSKRAVYARKVANELARIHRARAGGQTVAAATDAGGHAEGQL